MSDYNNTEILTAIQSACEKYVSEKIDGTEFRKVFTDIQNELWDNKDFVLDIIKLLVTDEELYNVALEKRVSFPELIYSFIPDRFWENEDTVFEAAELTVEFINEVCYYLSCEDIKGIFKYTPSKIRENRSFILKTIDLIAKWARGMDDLYCIDELIPDPFFENTDNLRYAVISMCEAHSLNAAEFGMFPSAVWKQKENIFLILSNLQDELETDRYNFTMYPNFRGSNQDYLELLLEYVDDSFKSDKDFILEFTDYDYFSDDFDTLYGWMDKELWQDKEIVLKFLENDTTSVIYIPKELAQDEEIIAYIDDNVDFDWALKGIADEKIPKWIKELRDKQ